MIKPEGIPKFEGNLEQVTQAANDLTAVGDEIKTIGTNLESKFRTNINANYADGPEKHLLARAMEPVKKEGDLFGPNLGTIGSALHTFVSEVAKHKTDLAGVRTRADAWKRKVGDLPEDEIDDNEEWVLEEQQLHTDLQAALDGISAAERRCANKIADLYGGKKWEDSGLRQGEQPPPDTGEEEKDPPWGKPLEYDAPWYEDCVDFVGGVLKGVFVDGLLGTLDALTTLIPIQPLLKSLGVDSIFGYELKGWSDAGNAWKGVGLTLAAAAMWATPGASLLMHAMFPETAAYLDNVGITVLKGMVAWDMWGEDPGRALGQVGFNVITTIGTGGAAGAVRATAIAGKYGSAAAKVAKGADVVVDIAGKLSPGQLAINTALKLPKVSDLVIKAGNTTVIGGMAKLGGLDIPTSRGGTPSVGSVDAPSSTPVSVGSGSHSTTSSSPSTHSDAPTGGSGRTGSPTGGSDTPSSPSGGNSDAPSGRPDSPAGGTSDTPSRSADAPNPSNGDSPGTSQGDAPSTSRGDGSSSSQGDAPSTSRVDSSGSSQGDAPGTSRGDAPSTSRGDSASTSQGDAPSTSRGDAPGTSRGDAPSTSHADSSPTGRADGQTTPGSRTPDAPSRTPDSSSAHSPDAPRTNTPDAPRTNTPDAPRTPDAPSTRHTPDAPRTHTPDAPRTPDAPAAHHTPDAPRTNTPDAPRTPDAPDQPSHIESRLHPDGPPVHGPSRIQERLNPDTHTPAPGHIDSRLHPDGPPVQGPSRIQERLNPASHTPPPGHIESRLNPDGRPRTPASSHSRADGPPARTSDTAQAPPTRAAETGPAIRPVTADADSPGQASAFGSPQGGHRIEQPRRGPGQQPNLRSQPAPAGRPGQPRDQVEPKRYDAGDPDGRLLQWFKARVGANPLRNVRRWVSDGNPHYRDGRGDPAATNNCGDNARVFADTLQGIEPRLANRDLKTTVDENGVVKPAPGEYAEMHEFTGVRPDRLTVPYSRNAVEYTSGAYRQIYDSLAGKPPGTVAIIGGRWDSARPDLPTGGHWFNAFVDESGVVRWADLQSGHVGPYPPPYPGAFRDLEVVVREPGGQWHSPAAPSSKLDVVGGEVRVTARYSDPRAFQQPRPGQPHQQFPQQPHPGQARPQQFPQRPHPGQARPQQFPQRPHPGQARPEQPVSMRPPEAAPSRPASPAGDQPRTGGRSPNGPSSPAGDFRSPEVADRSFRASPADHLAFRERYPTYDRQRLRLHLERGGDTVKPLHSSEILSLERILQMDHQDINLALRANDPAVDADPVVRNAVSGLNKLPAHHGEVHRGIHFDRPEDLERFLARYEVGGTVREKAFTHSDKDRAGSHSGNVQLHIDSRHGKDVTFLRDPHTGIQEVIHPPHTDFFPTAKHFDAETNTWHVYVRDHSGPVAPELPTGGPHDVTRASGAHGGGSPGTGEVATPDASGEQAPSIATEPDLSDGYGAVADDWRPGDAGFGISDKPGFDASFHHKALGDEYAPGVHDPDGVLQPKEREIAERLEQEGWRVDARKEDHTKDHLKNPECMVRKSPMDEGVITEFKTLNSGSANAAKRNINDASDQVPAEGEVVIDGSKAGLTEEDAVKAYRKALGQPGKRVAAKVHVMLADGRVVTFVKEN